MDVRKLRQILAIRQHGSFAKAARALGISQPSLSTSISRLEDELKAQIFVRGASGSELTPMGEAIADRAPKVIEEADSLVQAAKLAANGRTGQLRLGFGNSLNRALAPRLIAEIAERYPDLSLDIVVGDRPRLLPAMSRRDLDIAFTVSDPVGPGFNHVETHLLKTFSVALASPSHPLVEERQIEPDVFSGFNHSGPRNVAYTVKNIFGKGPLETDVTSYTSNDNDTLLELVSSGRATCVMAAFEAASYIRSGRVVPLDLDFSVPVDFIAVIPEAAAGSPLIKDVLDIARRICRDLEASQESLRRGERAGAR